MTFITISFEVHQPIRIRKKPLRILLESFMFENFFDDEENKRIFNKVANKCYLKTSQILLELLDQTKHDKNPLKVNFSFSGMALEQAEMYNKDVIEYFKQLAQHKNVEILGETYYHSLASLYESKDEFIEQVLKHYFTMKELFGVKPKVFMNTEMIYNNIIAKTIEELGFKGIVTEGAERILSWRSPNYVYTRIPLSSDDKPMDKRIKVFLRNYRLSDDIAFRFSARWWNEWPLTADKYAAWLSATPGQIINIYMDYETFGEHHWEETGIFWFLKALPSEIQKYDHLKFANFKDVIDKLEPVGEIDVFEFSTLSWADMERDVSAWLGNEMQLTAFEEIKRIREIVSILNDEKLWEIYRLLTQSDHFYYMCTKYWADGDVHKYFSNFGTPHQAFASYMNTLSQFKSILFTKLASMKQLQKIEKATQKKVKRRISRKRKAKIKS